MEIRTRSAVPDVQMLLNKHRKRRGAEGGEERGCLGGELKTATVSVLRCVVKPDRQNLVYKS